VLAAPFPDSLDMGAPSEIVWILPQPFLLAGSLAGFAAFRLAAILLLFVIPGIRTK